MTTEAEIRAMSTSQGTPGAWDQFSLPAPQSTLLSPCFRALTSAGRQEERVLPSATEGGDVITLCTDRETEAQRGQAADARLHSPGCGAVSGRGFTALFLNSRCLAQ